MPLPWEHLKATTTGSHDSHEDFSMASTPQAVTSNRSACPSPGESAGSSPCEHGEQKVGPGARCSSVEVKTRCDDSRTDMSKLTAHYITTFDLSPAASPQPELGLEGAAEEIKALLHLALLRGQTPVCRRRSGGGRRPTSFSRSGPSPPDG